MSKLKVLKYGAIGTTSAAAAAFLASASSAQPGFKEEAGKNAAKAAVLTGAMVTGAFLGRKYIAKGAATAAKAMVKDAGSKLGYVFRRIRGRIVKIKVK